MFIRNPFVREMCRRANVDLTPRHTRAFLHRLRITYNAFVFCLFFVFFYPNKQDLFVAWCV